LGLFKVLGSTSSEDESGRLGLNALSEHVVSLVTNLNLLKLATESKDVLSKSIDGSLKNGSSSFGNSSEIIFLNSSRAENISIGEVLGSKVTNWKVRKNDLGSRFDDLIELLVNNVPFGINDLLEIIWVFDPDLGVVLLSLELKLKLKNGDLWVLETFWLLLKSSIRECLFEADTSYKVGIGD